MAGREYNIKFNAQLKEGSLQSSIKKEEAQLKPLKLKAQIESSTGITGLTGKNAKLSAQTFKEMNKVSTAVDNFNTKLINLKTTGKLNEEQFNSFSNQLNQIYDDFRGGSTTFSEFTSGLNTLKNSVSQTSTQMGAMGQSLLDIIGKFTKWYLIAGLVTTVINLLKNMVTQTINLDKSMVELNKVFDTSSVKLNKVKRQAFDLADTLGTTGQNVIDATTEFKRMGYTIDQSLDLAKVAVTMTNVAEGITDAGDAANVLTSILKGTNTEVEYANSLLDRLNEISNNNAVSFDALAHMTQEASATMKILGNNLDETMGLLTGAYSVLQDESVASGIQTIGLRIAGLNEDMESVAGLSNEVVESLQKYAGISAFDEQTGQLKSTYDILEELAGVWDTIDKNQQSALLNTLAGKRQADVAAAILNNWDGVSKAVKDAGDSMGSAQKEQEAYLDSIEGRLNKLKNWFQELADTVVGSDTIKVILDVLGSILNVVGSIIKRIFKTLDIALKLAGTKEMLEMVASALNGIAWILEKINDVFDWIIDKIDIIKNSVKGWLGGIWNDIKSWFGFGDESDYKDLAETFKNGKDSVDEYTKSLNKLKQNLFDYNEELKSNLELAKKQQDALKHEQELQEKILSIEKAREALAEAKRKRARVFRAGIGFVYEEDAQEVQLAQEELTNAINELAEYKFDYALDRAEEFVERLTDLLQSDDITQGWSDLFEEFGDLLDTEFADYLNKTKEFVDKFNNEINNTKTYTSTAPEKLDIYSLLPNKYAKNNAQGTTNYSGGLTWVGEQGPELMNLPKGTEILNHSRSMKLHSIVDNPTRYVGSALGVNGTTLQFNGPLNFPNVTNANDAKGFIDAVISIGNNGIPNLV